MKPYCSRGFECFPIRFLLALVVSINLWGCPPNNPYIPESDPVDQGLGKGEAYRINERGDVLVRGGEYYGVEVWNEESGVHALNTPFNKAIDINNHGAVIGNSESSEQFTRAWVRDVSGEMQELTLGGYRSVALVQSSGGQVAGVGTTVSGEDHVFVWNASDGMRDLGPYGGGWLQITAVNDAGQVVGYTTSPSGEVEALFWDVADGKQHLSFLDGTDATANDINSAGQVVGDYEVPGGRQAYVWDAVSGRQDLGTLGGSYSSAAAINDAGQVVGESAIATGEYHAFLWDAASGMQDLGTLSGGLSSAIAINGNGQVIGLASTDEDMVHGFFCDIEGGMRDLGAFDGGLCIPIALNDAGQVVGISTDATGEFLGFLWDPSNGMQNLGLQTGSHIDWGSFVEFGITNNELDVDSYTEGWHYFVNSSDGGTVDLYSPSLRIHNSGQILQREFDTISIAYTDTAAASIETTVLTDLGEGFYPIGIGEAGELVGNRFYQLENTAMLFDVTDGRRTLGTLGGASSWVAAINDAGQIVGKSQILTGEGHAFLWDAAIGMQDLGTLGGDSSSAADINSLGQVVGQSTTASGETHAFWWDPAGGMIDLGDLEVSGTYAVAVNDIGQVAGQSVVAGEVARAFVWDAENGMQDLGSFGGASTWVRALNNRGEVVGNSEAADGTPIAFIWDTELGLQKLAEISSDAVDINDAGQVIGTAGGRPFKWDRVHKLQLEDSSNKYFMDINNLGEIAGYIYTYHPGSYYFGFGGWDETHFFVWGF